MIRPLTSYAKYRNRYLTCIGDSLTGNYALGVRLDLFWPTVLASTLYSASVPIRARNLGVSGQTTTQMLSRVAAMTAYDVPDIAVIWGGHNDLSNGISPATTTSNINAIVNALVTAGVTRIIICSTHCQNFASGGDQANATPSVGARLNLWNAQHDAYTAAVSAHPSVSFVWVDLYAHFYALLQANPAQIGVESYYHTATVAGDTHLNAFGNQQVAAAIYAQIPDAWKAALT